MCPGKLTKLSFPQEVPGQEGVGLEMCIESAEESSLRALWGVCPHCGLCCNLRENGHPPWVFTDMLFLDWKPGQARHHSSPRFSVSERTATSLETCREGPSANHKNVHAVALTGLSPHLEGGDVASCCGAWERISCFSYRNRRGD